MFNLQAKLICLKSYECHYKGQVFNNLQLFDHDKHAHCKHGHTSCIFKPALRSTVVATSIGMINFLLMDPPSPFLFGMPHRLNVAGTLVLFIKGQNIAQSWVTWSPLNVLMNLGDGWSWHRHLNIGSNVWFCAVSNGSYMPPRLQWQCWDSEKVSL